MAEIESRETVQAWRQPGSAGRRKEFRLPGTEVRACAGPDGACCWADGIRCRCARLAALGQYKDVPFMEEGREQPPMPQDDVSFDK